MPRARRAPPLVRAATIVAFVIVLGGGATVHADTALRPPSGYLAPVQIKKSSAQVCEPAPAPFTAALNFTSKYEGSGEARDQIDEESEAQYKEQTRPITDLEKRFTSLVTKYMKSGEPTQLKCAIDILSVWANARALEGEAPNHTGRSLRKWSLGSLSSAYLRLKFSSSAPLKAYPAQAARIEAWFGEIADHVKQEWTPTAPIQKLNNHYYWAAWAMMATSIATNRRDLFEQAAAIFQVFASQVDADGYLPNELARASRAVQYHAYALLPLSMLAAFGTANGVDFAAQGQGALARLAARTIEGLDHPSSFEIKAGAAQNLAALESNANWAWLDPYCWTVACTETQQARRKAKQPFAVTRLGGDVTALFGAAEETKPKPPTEVSSGVAALNQHCREFIESGQYEEALSRCKSAQSNAEKLLPGSKEHIDSLVNLGDLKRCELNYVDADAYYASALKILEGDPTQAAWPDIAALLDKLIDVKVKRGKFLDAQRLAAHLLDSQEKRAEADDPDVAALRARNADLLSQSRQFPEAEQAYIAAIAVLAHAPAERSGIYAQAVQHFAETYERQAKYIRAEGEYKRLLGIVDERKLGKNWSALALDRLGYVCEQQEKPLEALVYYQREMETLRTTDAPEEVAQGLRIKVARVIAARQLAER